jgi:hypothetical protein
VGKLGFPANHKADQHQHKYERTGIHMRPETIDLFRIGVGDVSHDQDAAEQKVGDYKRNGPVKQDQQGMIFGGGAAGFRAVAPPAREVPCRGSDNGDHNQDFLDQHEGGRGHDHSSAPLSVVVTEFLLPPHG